MGKFFYARVSSKDQNLARQIEAFKKMGAADEQIVCDKESGKNFNRENYKALKSALGLRAGDVLIVKELDRFGRNKQEILKELEYWKKREIRVMVIDIPTTMIDIPKGQEQQTEDTHQITWADKNPPAFPEERQEIFFCKTDIRNPLRYLLMNTVAPRT